ncbi:inosine/uridine-preferring nucleoside hydrolase [Diaporthe helianthi]|uniref:Inosine/uridine-preferring nucleoside hydrolase n=1 Tax=Diaporthe helianthi TaxID=158607 RepID=A0A2P5HQG8_DIAHE|nr:inosine/uridine-preferring nucleoside hydrolase [Diaporthe helianthi]
MLLTLRLSIGLLLWFGISAAAAANRKNLFIDTDLFSDCDDASALLLAATSPEVSLIGLNINYPSSYSALAASAILAHYGHRQVPIGIPRPISNETFTDTWSFELGEFTTKVAYHWRCEDCAVRWGHVDDDAWDPVALYRKTLSEAADDSVTIASIGFLNNLSGLLNSSGDSYSELTGAELVERKVAQLVVMGGAYPSGHEFNFWGYDPAATAYVINNWKGPMVFSGSELGGNVTTGGGLMTRGPVSDPVRAAYFYYTYNTSRFSWDPLTMLYAINGLGDLFEFGNDDGYNFVHPNGSNAWVVDENFRNQHWLKLKVDNVTAASVLDEMMVEASWSAIPNYKFGENPGLSLGDKSNSTSAVHPASS